MRTLIRIGCKLQIHGCAERAALQVVRFSPQVHEATGFSTLAHCDVIVQYAIRTSLQNIGEILVWYA